MQCDAFIIVIICEHQQQCALHVDDRKKPNEKRNMLQKGEHVTNSNLVRFITGVYTRATLRAQAKISIAIRSYTSTSNDIQQSTPKEAKEATKCVYLYFSIENKMDRANKFNELCSCIAFAAMCALFLYAEHMRFKKE